MRSLRLGSDQEGVVMTEFIIVAPLFCLLVVGTIQIMGLEHADALLQHANFMAARAGSVHYERIRTDDYRHDLGREMTSAQMVKLRDIMEDAAEFAMGPLHARLAGFTELGNTIAGETITVNTRSTGVVTTSRTRYSFWRRRRGRFVRIVDDPGGTFVTITGPEEQTPIYSSPVDVFEMKVFPGEIRLDDGTYTHNNWWITSRSEAKIAMGYAFVGNIIQMLHLQAIPIDVEDTQEFARQSFDAFATKPNASAQSRAQQMRHRGMPYIVVSSDAFMDTWTNDGEERELRWPFNATGGSYRELRGSSFSNVTLETGPNDPQPIALPIWDRHRFEN